MKKYFLIAQLLCVVVVSSFAQQWAQVGAVGDWKNTIDVVSMNGSFYSLEADGTLFKTDKNGTFNQIGERGFFENADFFSGTRW